jgi:preprotein translocase subunit SecE
MNMTYQSKKNNTALNTALWVFSILLACFAIINQQYISYDHILLKFIVTVSAVGIALLISLKKTTQGLKFSKYWLSAVTELKKVTWPSKQETMRFTLAVVVMVIVMGLVLWTIDSILVRLVAWLLQRGG